ncbi:Crp/Fnr family transcriptional regulator [Streptomyces sp. NPDC096136]|uniref:Crp/Fnr family transcriptional regulator n=1 Tax=Streptomyces sp. NPDC096136 TaxID=3366076 RepID=UPI0038096E7C
MSEDRVIPVRILRDLVSSEAWAGLTRYPRTYQPGRRLLEQGTEGVCVLALISGLVKVIRRDRIGTERLLAFRGPGEILGEMALQHGGGRLADVWTMSVCKASVVSADDFSRFVRDHKLAAPLAQLATNRLVEQTTAHDGDVRERLVTALLRLIEVSRGEVSFSLTRQELAQHIGVGRKAVAKALEQLGPGCVQGGKGHITVTDVAALRAALGSPVEA